MVTGDGSSSRMVSLFQAAGRNKEKDIASQPAEGVRPVRDTFGSLSQQLFLPSRWPDLCHMVTHSERMAGKWSIPARQIMQQIQGF